VDGARQPHGVLEDRKRTALRRVRQRTDERRERAYPATLIAVLGFCVGDSMLYALNKMMGMTIATDEPVGHGESFLRRPHYWPGDRHDTR
jgi:hypothetical protein